VNNLKSFEEYKKLNEEEQYYDGESLIGLYIVGTIFIGLLLMILGSGDNGIMNMVRKYLFRLKSAKYYTQEMNDLVVELSEEQRRELKRFIKRSVFIKWSRKDFFNEEDNDYFMTKRRKFDEELQELLKIFNQEQRVRLMTLLGKLKDELERQWFRNWGFQEGKERNPDFKSLKNMK
jgi:hypothetical protein